MLSNTLIIRRLLFICLLFAVTLRSFDIADQFEEEWYYAYEDELPSASDIRHRGNSHILFPKTDLHHSEPKVTETTDSHRTKDDTAHGKALQGIQKNRAVGALKPLATQYYIENTAESYGCAPQSKLYRKDVESDEALYVQRNEPIIEPQDKKKLSFKEIQEEKSKQSMQLKQKREKIKPKYLLGASCETLVCGSCKAVVEELSVLITKASKNVSVQTVDEVIDSVCASRTFNLMYDDIVINVCEGLTVKNSAYYNFIAKEFESYSESWSTLQNVDILNANKKKICEAVGACSYDQFQIKLKPTSKFEKHWDEECFICQAFARGVEERVHMARSLSENSIYNMIKQTCENMVLGTEQDLICRTLTQGKTLDDIAWLTKVHEENIAKQRTSDRIFPDSLCEEIGYCEPYLDPEEKLQKEAKEEIKAVFY